MFRFSFFPERPLEQYRKTDAGVLISMILLWGLGIVTLYFCSSEYSINHFNSDIYLLKRQLVYSAVGLVGAVVLASINMKVLRRLLPLLVLCSVVLNLLVPVFGAEVNHATRWIKLPFLPRFQPSEIIKFVAILYLANILDKYRNIEAENRRLWPAVVGFGIMVASVAIQKDFSTSILIAGIGLIIFFIYGAKMLTLIPILCLLVPFAILLIFSQQYRIERLLAFFHPEEYSRSFAYQFMKSRDAICAGGLWGNGIGSGLSKLYKIPEVYADYIFAGWAESMGLIGVTIYFILLCFFAYRSYKIAFETNNFFAAIAVFGFTSLILLQSLMNCAVAAGVIPTTGIPLPFFSYGGSSMVFTLCMCGFIINVSRHDDSEEIE